MADIYDFFPTEKMLSPTSLAQMLDVSERHLADVRRENSDFPAPVLIGTLPRWSPSVIRRWMEHGPQAHQDAPTQPSADKPVITTSKRKAARRVH